MMRQKLEEWLSAWPVEGPSLKATCVDDPEVCPQLIAVQRDAVNCLEVMRPTATYTSCPAKDPKLEMTC